MQYIVIVVFMPLAVTILMAVGLGSNSIGAGLLPQPIVDAITRLLPMSLITDASADADGNIYAEVSVAGIARRVVVRTPESATIAWSYAAGLDFPQSGTYAIAKLQHELEPNSTVKPEDLRERVGNAIRRTLEGKGFEEVDEDAAEIIITPFVSIEDGVSIDVLSGAINPPDAQEWGLGIRKVLQADITRGIASTGKGALTLDLFDVRRGINLWRALAFAKIVIEIGDVQRDARMTKAVGEMLRQFPPRLAKSSENRSTFDPNSAGGL